jgi:hypothetical protein
MVSDALRLILGASRESARQARGLRSRNGFLTHRRGAVMAKKKTPMAKLIGGLFFGERKKRRTESGDIVIPRANYRVEQEREALPPPKEKKSFLKVRNGSGKIRFTYVNEEGERFKSLRSLRKAARAKKKKATYQRCINWKAARR